jgi:hypothetical protein
MATNAAKTFICNLAISKTKQGVTDVGQSYVDAIEDSYFEDYTTVPGGDNNETVRRLCLYYETTLIRCLRALKPKFARRIADLGNEIDINKEYGDWEYVFELPSNYLELIRQTDEGNRSLIYHCDVLEFSSYAHCVIGTDDEVYYCSTAHTSASATKPITGANYATYWTEESTDEYTGADWETGKAYVASESGKLLFTNHYSNDDRDSAYIEYLQYAQSGVSDDPDKYPDYFKHALATLLACEITLDYDQRLKLLQEYKNLAEPDAAIEQSTYKVIAPKTKVLDARRNLRVTR